ncbi:MAG: CRISPR-associated helicase Cas3' [Xanthobacter sp.]
MTAPRPQKPVFFAHSTERQDKSDWEPLPEHQACVAVHAGQLARSFGAEKAAILAGGMHDLGKYSLAFQRYIQGQGLGVDHSTAGAQQAYRLGETAGDRLMAQLVAYAIAGHHAGLPNFSGESATLSSRLEKSYPIEPLHDIWREEVQPDASGLLPPALRLKGAMCSFQLSILGRFIFSALVDADFLETEAFYARQRPLPADRTWPTLQAHLPHLIQAFDTYMAAKLSALPEERRNHPLNQLRQDILTHVRGQAQMRKGIFTLDVPTGGGKTLASLAFALEHAQAHGHSRIIYGIPFTSIIEQTAEIFRDVLGEEMVLEHHSAIEPAGPQNEQYAPTRAQMLEAKQRLAMENWDAPVVVTTSVQFFESLFAHRPSRCRKLHNIANSVIILDEAQIMPLHVLRPCVAMLDELALNYGCTIVLCTATQPALIAPHFKGGFAPESVHELAPDPEKLDAALRRVTLEMRPAPLSDEELVAELAGWDQCLVIVNGRRHARALYEAALEADMEGVLHLSTRQTAADRSRLLADIRTRLAAGKPCRVIATSVIEAGVDVSFPRVWRAIAGLDSIIQAAGRLNREGKWAKEDSRITVFIPTEAKPPKEIEQHVAALTLVIKKHADLLSKAAIKAYFEEVYWQKNKGLDRISLEKGQTGSVLGQFSADLRGTHPRTDFAYRTVGENFRMIENAMLPVIINRTAETQQVLDELEDQRITAGEAARRLQRHLVQVPARDRSKLIESDHIIFRKGFSDQFAELVSPNLYTTELGLLWENADDLGGDFII